MKRDEVLKTAKTAINGQRAKDYGDAYDNFTRIADGWNLIVKEAQCTNGYITPQHVALMLDWMKTARLLHNLDSADGWVDKVGYSALGSECGDRENEIQERLNLFIGKVPNGNGKG
jgi:hypothetical protein